MSSLRCLSQKWCFSSDLGSRAQFQGITVKCSGLSLGVQGLDRSLRNSSARCPSEPTWLGSKERMGGRKAERRGRGERGTLSREKRRETRKRNLQKNPSLFLLSAVPKRCFPLSFLQQTPWTLLPFKKELFCSARRSGQECRAEQQGSARLLSTPLGLSYPQGL